MIYLQKIYTSLLLAFFGSFTLLAQVSDIERAALIALYNATDGDNWTDNTNWLSDEPVSDWYGVTVYEDNVQLLQLGDNNLTGTLPSELSNLSSVIVLNFYSNNLKGKVPVELTTLTTLSTFNIAGNESIFSDLEPVHEIFENNSSLTYIYSLISNADEEETLIIDEGGSILLKSTDLTSENNTYEWYKSGGSLIGTITGNEGLLIEDIALTDAGGYYFTATNSIITGRTIYSNIKTLEVNDICRVATEERDALVALYNATDGVNWTNTWDLSADVCDWYGITVDDEVVKGIDLPSNNLVGSFPEALANLEHLEYLNLSNNDLTGEMPVMTFGSGTIYNFTISNNELYGQLPEFVNMGTNTTEAFLGAGTAIFVDNNNFVFTDIRDEYINQAKYYLRGSQANLPADSNKSIEEGESLIIYGNERLSHVDNVYKWLKLSDDGLTYEGIDGATEKNYTVNTSTKADGGIYKLEITNNTINQGAVSGGTITQDSTTVTVSEAVSIDCVSDEERAALVALYNATDGANWTNNTNWLTDEPVSEWYGITVDDNCKVIRLFLESNNLVGNIPVEIGDLNSLENMLLGFNNLNGSIPIELGNLSSIDQLYLNNNDLSGQIPSEFKNLTNITIINLQSNNLTGQIPSELGDLKFLENLFLNFNSLTGSIPSAFKNLTSLKGLYLNSNKLTGAITSELEKLSSLNNFYFKNNTFVFSDFENEHFYYNENINSYNYSPQAKVDQEEILSVEEGNSITLTSTALTSPNNTYQWYKDGVAIGTTTTAKELVIENATEADAGVYYFTATNSIVTDLTLTRNTITLNVEETTTTDCVSTEEKAALWALYQSTDGDNWTNTLAGDQPWSLDTPVCDWYGVTVIDGAVNKIDLRVNNLVGNIPVELGSLSLLNSLFLQDNELTGNIPSELGNLKSLISLTLNSNSLTGNIPQELGELSSLKWLFLFYNELEGEIPPELGNLGSVLSITLRHNKLEGEIPSSLGNLANLISLDLGNNELKGEIPSSLGNLANLISLDLSYNELEGGIPSELGNLTDLSNIDLRNNELEGGIPSELGNLSSLVTLYLDDNNLSGGIPKELNFLSSLILFEYNLNNFVFSDFESEHQSYVDNLTTYSYTPQAKVDQEETLTVIDGGAITLTSTALTSPNNTYQWYKDGIAIGEPTTTKELVIENATEADAGSYYFTATNSIVTDLTLTRNTITLEVTEVIDTCGVSDEERAALVALYNATDGANWTNTWDLSLTPCDWYGVTVSEEGLVTSLQLQTNNLVGEIPAEIGDLVNLEWLYLYENALEGVLPPELGNIISLRFFVLYATEVTGDLPPELGNLSNLETFAIYYNKFTGEIPSELGNLSSIKNLYLGSNQFKGTIPVELGQLTNLERFDAYNNGLSGSIPDVFKNLTNLLSIGLGKNNLSGVIPSELSELVDFNLYKLAENNFVFSDFEDSFLTYQSKLGESFTYFPQANVDQVETVSVQLGGEITLTSEALTSPNNTYQWYKDGVAIGEPTITKELVFDTVTAEDAGEYYFTATNSVVTDLTLTRNPITLTVTKVIDTCGVSDEERAALVTLYNATDGANWTNTWDLSLTPCSWYGVTVSNATVTKVQLPTNNLVGEIPAEIGNLSSLQNLQLNGNSLQGNLPIEIGNLSNLTNLTIQDNGFTGTIPEEFENLTNLSRLTIDRNELSGDFPSVLINIPSLTYLTLSGNNFTGTIPTSISNLTKLWWLSLADNDFEGDFPNVTNIIGLKYLYLQSNSFSGAIPAEIGNLTEMVRMSLHVNNFEGAFPAEIGQLTNLVSLFISENNFTGPIPPEFGNLTKLTGLYSTNNSFSGSIPSEFGNLTSLTALYFGGNELSGSVPIELSNLVNLTNLRVSDNYLTGIIPLDLADYPSLTYFTFNGNNFVYNDISESYLDYSDFYYHSQKNVIGSPDQTVQEGATLTITANERFIHPDNKYQWYKSIDNGNSYLIVADGTSKDLVIESVSTDDTGLYRLSVFNDVYPSISVIHQEPTNVTLTVDTCAVSAEEKATLWALYESTGGQFWTNTVNGDQPWDLNTPVCEWYGVAVGFGATSTETGYGVVTGINLSDNNLKGYLPVELGVLSNMFTFYVNDNNLVGHPDNEIYDYTGMTSLSIFDIHNNQMTGNLPDFGDYTSLDVSINNFVFNDFRDEYATYSFYQPNQTTLPADTSKFLFVNDELTILGNERLLHPDNEYQWYKLDDGGETYEVIDGATSKDYVVENVTVEDAGMYKLEISNSLLGRIPASKYLNYLVLEQEPTIVVVSNNPDDTTNQCTSFPYATIADIPIPNGGESVIWYETNDLEDDIEDEPYEDDDDVYPEMELYAAIDDSEERFLFVLPSVSGIPGSYGTIVKDDNDEEIDDEDYVAGEDYQVFYTSENANPTLNDLQLTTDGVTAVNWYASENSTEALPMNTPLENEGFYYAAYVNASCRFEVEVAITPGYIEIQGYAIFCAAENATISTLTNDYVYDAFGNTVKWYTEAEGGELLDGGVLLENGKTYYATLYDEATGVEEVVREDIYVEITSVPDISVEPITQTVYKYEYEDAQIKHIVIPGTGNLVWYANENSREENNEALSKEALITDGATYYATQQFAGTDCESDEVVAVTVFVENYPPPEIILCEKFRPSIGTEYVFNGWVRQQGVSLANEEVSVAIWEDETEKVNTLLKDLLNDLLEDFVFAQSTEALTPTQRVVPNGYIPDPDGRKYDPLIWYIKDSPSDVLKIYNFEYIYEDHGIKRAIGFQFSFTEYADQDHEADVVYKTPLYNSGTSALSDTRSKRKFKYDIPAVPAEHYPLFHYDTNAISINFLGYDENLLGDEEIKIMAEFKVDESYRNLSFHGKDKDKLYKDFKLLNSNTSAYGTEVINNINFSRDLSEYEIDVDYQVSDYTSTLVQVEFEFDEEDGSASTENVALDFESTGVMIDGWQKVTASFVVPEDATYMSINLINDSAEPNVNSYFDDIRIHPYNSNLKTFVYDPITQLLRAELDENNFATFYEYDNEGGLIRVKKETERGIYTIQETRSNTSKITNQNN